ncbi:helix-turn-helix transcriptional regulator [Paenibacillus agri]|uniref:Helix-turn-helix domain-containing protein n=1 Tax=Paenibacillus agri TaxID=2744309 RepID=A0A850EU23_9BACL|nr:helix-turn-helix transcriptional regulator [Paenibacillus agri]NUU62997.1 helix-turn-helix domain-containing protein [Paenibacillus agri]
MNHTKQRHHELGDFLKTRRAKISPEQVGLPAGIRRRTPGLRREEVASLAGIGVTWYTWLEQGRPIQVSIQILESLSRVLMLNRQEIVHLYALAQHVPPSYYPSPEEVKPMHQHVLDNLMESPAMIVDNRWNVIAWNRAAALVFCDFSQLECSKRNLMRIMFTDKHFAGLFPDWEISAQTMLGKFRADCSQYIEDPWITQFVDELRSLSKEFDQWWPMHRIDKDRDMYKLLNHRLAGQLNFEITSFLISENTNLKMYVNTPKNGTDTRQKLKQLLEADVSEQVLVHP